VETELAGRGKQDAHRKREAHRSNGADSGAEPGLRRIVESKQAPRNTRRLFV